MSQVCIRGVGCYLPDARLTNQALATRLGVTDDYIVKLTGIHERRRAAPEEATSDMAVLAAQAALEDARLNPEVIDGVLVATATPDHVTPATANLVQRRLGLRPVPTYDLNAGCTGSLYALITASGLIRAGMCSTMLVIGAEIVSRLVDLDDPETALVFGDGAGALVLQAGAGQHGDLHLLSHLWGSDGTKADVIMVPAGGSRCPASSETVEKRQHFFAHERQQCVSLCRADFTGAGAGCAGAGRAFVGRFTTARSAPGELAYHRGRGAQAALRSRQNRGQH